MAPTPLPVTVNDLEGHSPVAGLFKCNSSIICAAFHKSSKDRASCGPPVKTGLHINPNFGTHYIDYN